jgi:hypothetical protein
LRLKARIAFSLLFLAGNGEANSLLGIAQFAHSVYKAASTPKEKPRPETESSSDFAAATGEAGFLSPRDGAALLSNTIDAINEIDDTTPNNKVSGLISELEAFLNTHSETFIRLLTSEGESLNEPQDILERLKNNLKITAQNKALDGALTKWIANNVALNSPTTDTEEVDPSAVTSDSTFRQTGPSLDSPAVRTVNPQQNAERSDQIIAPGVNQDIVQGQTGNPSSEDPNAFNPGDPNNPQGPGGGGGGGGPQQQPIDPLTQLGMLAGMAQGFAGAGGGGGGSQPIQLQQPKIEAYRPGPGYTQPPTPPEIPISPALAQQLSFQADPNRWETSRAQMDEFLKSFNQSQTQLIQMIAQRGMAYLQNLSGPNQGGWLGPQTASVANIPRSTMASRLGSASTLRPASGLPQGISQGLSLAAPNRALRGFSLSPSSAGSVRAMPYSLQTIAASEPIGRAPASMRGVRSTSEAGPAYLQVKRRYLR